MISKEIIGVLLVSGSLQFLAADKSVKSSELNSDDFRNKEVRHYQDEKKFQDVSTQFMKAYNKWGSKKSADFNNFRDRSDIKIYQMESGEFADKYNKYGQTFNINSLLLQKDKSYHKKRASEFDKHHEEHEKPKSLHHDTDVNFVNNKKKIPGDSELISENAVSKNKENYEENYQNKNELYLKRFKKDFYQHLNKIDLTSPPSPNDTVLMARYIVHTVDWASLATLSARSETKGSPFICVKATSDGMKNASSGIPFFYMSPMDLCTQDLQKDNRVSVLVTLLETEYCKNQNLDPQDPRCAKLTLSGKIKKIKPGSDEEKFAKNALFSRHPAMEDWPADHNWYFTKLKIGQIILLDQFGGATYIKVKDYLNGKIVEPEIKK